MLGKIQAFMDGKKAYSVAVIIFVLSIWVAMGHVIPDYIWTLLGALGLGAVRSAIDGNSTPKV